MAQIQHYWHVLLRWKWTAAAVFFSVLAAAVIYTFTIPPVYTARGSVWIDEDPNILPFQEVQALGAGTTLQSHARLLQSRALAAAVIEKLKLFERPEIVGKQSEKDGAINTSDPIFRERLIQKFGRSLSAAPVSGTRLVDVKFSSRDPALAAETLNALFDGFIDMLARKQYQASEIATEFLNAQMTAVRNEISEREKELSKLGTEKNILPLTAAETPTVEKMAEINKNLTGATIDRINKWNRYNQIKSAPLGEIPDGPAGSLLQKLREEYRTLSREYAKRLSTLTPEYPDMVRLKSELDAASDALQSEVRNTINLAYSDYQAALQKETSLQNYFDGIKTEAFKVSGNSVLYNSLRMELEQRKDVLETLSKRQSETVLSSQLKDVEAINVWIVDRADYPLRPSSPQKRKNALLGFLIGLAGSLCLVLGLEYLNQAVKTSKDIATATGLPTLGMIPSFEVETRSSGPFAEFSRILWIIRGREAKKGKKKRKKDPSTGGLWFERSSAGIGEGNGRKETIELIAIRKPRSIQAESYRSIRTTLLVSSPPGKMKTLLFSSPLAGEGKSSTVANVGITLATGNMRVVIVDADLRKPKQRDIFNYGKGPGLTRFLSSCEEPTDIAKPTQVPNLYLVQSGPLPPDPLELLTSEKMDHLVVFLKSNFEYILIDTPPILAVSDAIALGPLSDGIILVARGGRTPIPALKQAKQKLDAHRLKCIGVILNGVDLIEQDGYYSRQYYHYYKTD